MNQSPTNSQRINIFKDKDLKGQLLHPTYRIPLQFITISSECYSSSLDVFIPFSL